ncbi:recombinase family protein [Enterococcus faecalis]|uniref:recombinase family protein n=1 Tax=Enterococcus faecalis TaxID=1351 RepID=UPI000CF19524|nr:recombinase family protein [Enterococcus faecalis]MBO6372949.1 recombinase family protein [Enterococcus faecalis]MCO5488730.1 recombinase family protein [Enterococcus faecalis]MDN3096607.1 recombinase family protein [Enterococcus faecalis]PQD11464.1 Pin-related site-specific recombinase/DNA invertase [Enterococcus faecalis]PQG36865.1 Pin-related site-specific recombinase/DNA invertase [Enterococcus faecalis]
MAKIGYARVSSVDQNLDRQLELLSQCDKIFTDKVSGKDTNRDGFQEMMKFIRESDIIVVTELKRLGRNNKELTETMNLIQMKKATLEVLNLPSLTGITDDNLRRLLNNLIIELYKYQAEEERRYIRETQQQGITLAKAKGKYRGGKPKYRENDPRLQLAFKLFLAGSTDKEVEEQTGINRRTFRRYRMKYGITDENRKKQKNEK